MEQKRDDLAELEGNYYSNIQYPAQWIETGVKDLKQDVNSNRRESCKHHHKWGYQKGWDACKAECDRELEIVLKTTEGQRAINDQAHEKNQRLIKALEVAKGALKFYGHTGNWSAATECTTSLMIANDYSQHGDTKTFYAGTTANEALEQIERIEKGKA